MMGNEGSSSPGGRRTAENVLDKVVRALEYVEMGASIRDACQRVECTESSFYRLRNKADAARSSSPTHPKHSLVVP